MTQKRKIGILGGSFDPITIGHVKLAEFVLNSGTGVDEVWLMPCNSHVSKDIVASNGQRECMCNLATRDSSNIFVSSYEFDHCMSGGTLKLFNQMSNDKFLSNYEFYFIIGMDNANGFHKWIKYDELLRKAKFIVVPRKGWYNNRNVNVDWYLNPPHIFLDEDTNIPDISSTRVRDEIRMLKELEGCADIYDQEAYAMLKISLSDNIGSKVLSFILDKNIY